VTLRDASKLDSSGALTRIGDRAVCTAYIRSGNLLAINPPLPEDVSEGTVVRAGPCSLKQVYEQDSCAIDAAAGSNGLGLLTIGVLGFVLRRVRGWRRAN
jgi:hypothetical protein